MSFSDLPDELIAHISSYLLYPDICSIMVANKKNYNAIKRFGKDKIKLDELWIDALIDFSIEAFQNSKSYGFKLLDSMNGANSRIDVSVILKKMLDECSSIYFLKFLGIEFTSEIYQILMETKVKIRIIHIYSEQMLLSVDQMLTLCQKFKRVNFGHKYFNPAIWNDDVLMQVLPYSFITKNNFLPIENQDTPDLITNRLLNTLVGPTSLQMCFSMAGVYNSITIENIVNIIKIIADQPATFIDWNLGILRASEKTKLELYFPENGKLAEICELSIFTGHDDVPAYTNYEIRGVAAKKFHIQFSIASITL